MARVYGPIRVIIWVWNRTINEIKLTWRSPGPLHLIMNLNLHQDIIWSIIINAPSDSCSGIELCFKIELGAVLSIGSLCWFSKARSGLFILSFWKNYNHICTCSSLGDTGRTTVWITDTIFIIRPPALEFRGTCTRVFFGIRVYTCSSISRRLISLFITRGAW